MKKLAATLVAVAALAFTPLAAAPAQAAPVVNALELTYNDPTLSYGQADTIKVWATGVCKAIQRGGESVNRVNRQTVAYNLRKYRGITTTRDNIDLIIQGIRECA